MSFEPMNLKESISIICFKSSVSSPECSSLHLSGLRPSLLPVLALKAVLAPPGPAAALRGGVKDHARVINESLRKITLSYCCLCFCIMDEGRNEERVKGGKKRELCNFLALWWMNLMPLIHTLLSDFFLPQCFSCSLSALCQSSL